MAIKGEVLSAAARIKAAREDHKLTQEQAAKRASLSLRTYTRIENAENNNPKVRHLVNIAFALDMEDPLAFVTGGYRRWIPPDDLQDQTPAEAREPGPRLPRRGS